MRRVAFLALNDLHQIYHVAPIAVAAGRRTDVEADIYCSTRRAAEVVERIKTNLGGGRLRICMAGRGWRRLWVSVRGKPFPRVSAVLRQIRPVLRGYDAVVVPDYYGLGLRDQSWQPLLVYCQHGAGDRAYGYLDHLREFDLVLVPGPKVKARMDEMGGVRAEIVGYPKFDLLHCRRVEADLPRRTKRVVVYNPHFDRELSSWYQHGEAILKLARRRDDYEWVFSPHVKLVQEARLGRELVRRFQNARHVRIDLGSDALFDMSYARSADLYIGDVSSQVYEYLHRPMPCIFFNTTGAEPTDPNFLHLSLGKVVKDVRELEQVLDRDHGHQHLEMQRRIFNETFELSAKSSSTRAVEAILRAIEEDPNNRRNE